MPLPTVSVPADVARAALARLRDDLELPPAGDPALAADALAAAGDAARRGPRTAERADRRDLDLVTIDPAGSRDLDQAVHVVRRRRGWRVHYAIADVAAFVTPGDPVDLAARSRGLTRYLPDGRIPLHPTVLSEGAASLLAGEDRPAVLWTLDVDADGRLERTEVERAWVRSRRAYAYEEAGRELADGTAPDGLVALRGVGRARLADERDRGAVSLALPSQEVRARPDGWSLAYDAPLPVERWNAQISLLTGIAAAGLMAGSGHGVLRTLPPAAPDVVAELRHEAHAAGVAWPDGLAYAEWARDLDPAVPAEAALLTRAARALRGAGYLVLPAGPDAHRRHEAIAAEYAHVTAPLRRLVDRYATETALAAAAGRAPADDVLAVLPTLPDAMAAARRAESEADRAVVDLVEALVLAPAVGRRLRATVVSVHGERRRVMVDDPAVVAELDGAAGAEPGDVVDVVVAEVDVAERLVRLAPA